MNLGALKQRVRAVLRDDDWAFVKEQEVEDWLNEAALDIAVRLGLFRKQRTQADAVILAGGLIALPADLYEIKTLRLGTDDVEFTNDEVFNSWKDATLTPDQKLGRVFGANIELYPAPATTAAYELRYVATPTLMDTPEDEPDSPTQAIPEHLHPKLVRYAQAHALIKEREVEQGETYLAMYEQGLPPPPLGRVRIHPGPLRLSPVPSIFEEDER